MADYGWAPVLAEAMKTATLEPREPIWPTPGTGVAQRHFGGADRTADGEEALDGVASNWQRSLRRAGLGR